MASGTETLKRTPLHDRHAAAGAKLVPFAGWEMPVQYAGIREEHVAVRTKVGVFDVSHMGEIETSGPGSEAFLQRILSNDVGKIAADGAQYSVLCKDDGGVLDDLFTYRLGARDTLRLEVCFHLYGNDLSEDRGPIEAGLGWCCKEDTGFIGSDVIREQREQGTEQQLVPFVLTAPGIARQGNPVVGGGEVTSGTLSPCLNQGIGMAYLPAGSTEPGTAFEIDVRGRTRPAEVRAKPLYRKEG